MSIFGKFNFAGVSEELFAKLQSDLGAEIALFREFSDKYGKRLNELKAVVNAYQSNSPDEFRVYTDFILNLEQKNNEIMPLVSRLIDTEKKEELLVKTALFMFKAGDMASRGVSEEEYQRVLAITSRSKIEALLESLDRSMNTVHDNLLALKEILSQQIKYLKDAARKKKYIAYERDYGVYLLLKDEVTIANIITRSLGVVLSETKRFLTSPARFYERKEFGKLHVEEILPYNLNRDFVYLYESVYCRLFPDPDEREPLENFVKFLSTRLKDFRRKSMTHIVMLKSGPVPVGGLIFDFVGLKNLCYAVVWFIFIEKEFRVKGLPMLISHARNQLDLDLKHFGYSRMASIFGEAENPELLELLLKRDLRKRFAHLKKYFKDLSDKELEKIIKIFDSKKQQKALKFETLKDRVEIVKRAVALAQEEVTKLEYKVAVSPATRLRLYKKLNFKKLDLSYVQLPLGGGNPVYHLYMICMPLNPEWRDGIPSKEMEAIYRHFVVFGFDRDPDKESICQRIIREIRSKPIVRLVDL